MKTEKNYMKVTAGIKWLTNSIKEKKRQDIFDHRACMISPTVKFYTFSYFQKARVSGLPDWGWGGEYLRVV